ncbi:MAG TPA: hypothetical protein VLM43_10990 [Desulfobacterales bacterium]|nr:hypothetical protein [Desulfobacterales bacterium]
MKFKNQKERDCLGCGETKKIYEFYLIRNFTVIDSRCKKCRSIEASEKNRIKAEKNGRKFRPKNVYNKNSKFKVCTRCGINKPIIEYNKGGRGKDGYQPKCKKCRKELREKNKENISKQQLEWQSKNRRYKTEYQKKYYKKVLKKRHSYKVATKARTILRDMVRQISCKKPYRVYNELGYDVKTLKEHIEAQFKDGMSWKNHGQWHIDHITPISYFVRNGVEDLSIINALDNIQPLWRHDNMKKGIELIWEKGNFYEKDNDPMRYQNK